MFSMPFTEENEELQDGGIQEDDDAERLELMRYLVDWVLED
jgi:hypothetical protein